MTKQMSAPIVLKMIYISKTKTAVSSTDAQVYQKYIKDGAKETDLLKVVSGEQEIVRHPILEEADDQFGIYFLRDVENEITQRMRELSETKNHIKAYDQVVSDSIYDICQKNNKDSYQGQLYYNNYISLRQGSHGVFSYLSENTESLSKQLMTHTGTIYLPIVTLKEKDAVLVGLDTEQAWTNKTREFVEEMAKTMRWDIKDVRWIGAYHEKSDEQQNKLQDAGKQPHVHLMVWNPQDARTLERLTMPELTKLRQKTGSIYLGAWLESQYKQEEANKRDVRSSAEIIREEIMQDRLWQVQINITKAMNGKGRLTAKTIANSIAILSGIYKKLDSSISLTMGEYTTLDRLGVKADKESVMKRIDLFRNVDDELKNMVDYILDYETINPVYKDWLNNKFDISRAWASENEATDLLAKEDSGLRKIIYNTLLKNEGNWIDRIVIDDGLARQLYSKIEKKVFHSNLSSEDAYEMTTPIIQILMSLGETDDDIHYKVSGILDKSDKKFSSAKLYGDIIRARIKNDARDFTVSKKDCHDMMRALNFKENEFQYPYRTQVRLRPYPNARNMVNDFFKVEKQKDNRNQREKPETRNR